MPVRRLLFTLLALSTLALTAGCGGDRSSVAAEEANDPTYQQAQDLKKQGRYNEALNGFLKVIDRRGENGAPESHLEAGALYLNWSHNPVEAYHHFSKYLELQPTGPRSAIVRGQREAALREIARYLLAPTNNQGVGVELNNEVEQLRRQVQELKAENEALRGASSVPVVRAPPMISLPDESSPAAVASNDEVTPVAQSAGPAGPSFTRNLNRPSGANSVATSVPTRASPTTGKTATAAAPTRPGTPQRPNSGARTHTVANGEKSLWGIARQYYGASVNQARVTALYEANRDVMRSPNDLRPGMVLRIP